MTALPVRVPSGARWSCHACGACCRLFQLGPVEPHIIEGLKAHEIEAAWAPAAAQPWYEARETPAGTQYFLAKVDGACIFLKEDNLCAVHGLFGAEAKPSFCREFPFHFVQDPKGLVAIARGDCAGFHASSLDGEPLEQQIAAQFAIPRMRPVPRFNPAQVDVVPGLAVSLGDWMNIEAELLGRLPAVQGGPEALVADLRGWIWERTDVEAISPRPERYRLAARAMVHTLLLVLDRVAAEPGAPAAEQRFTVELIALLRRASERLDGPLPPLDGDAARHLNLLLRTHLLSKAFQPFGGVGFGLGLFLFNALIGRVAAEPNARGVITAAAHSAVYTKLVRLTLNHTIQQVLLKARPALLDLFLHADPALTET